ncbi:MAG: J domain-containing protein [Desulfobulbaceae bacterium]|nr:J domain-containing protein [Desulfobulbaceae bacterium]HIJ91030.1 DnaJ domain-containing protein [Deltaproteobacteria bacterium]
METVAAEKELFRSCEIIFGPELTISREFLDYLQLSGIKSAYRKRAMETHPDRAALENDRVQRQRHDLFHAVQEAYENLITFLDAKEKGYCLPPPAHQMPPRTHTPRPASPKPHRPQQAKPNPGASNPYQQTRAGAQTKAGFRNTSSQPSVFWDTESLYQGPLPNRRLLLGHFLYYSGLINWRTIIQALIWQRTERPRLGEIGQRFGLLNEADVVQILRNRPILQPFGQTAMNMGLLSQPQLQMLVAHQKRLQKKFGEFFLEKRIFEPNELRTLLQQYQEHNAKISGQTYGSAFRR